MRPSPGASRTSRTRAQNPSTAAASGAPSGSPASSTTTSTSPASDRSSPCAAKPSRGQVRQATRRDRLRCHQPDAGGRIPATPAHPQSRALDHRGDAPHPRLELRRGSQPHPLRPRAGEHDTAQALRHRPHQGPRARRRRDHAQSGQEPEAGPRLPEDDRQRRTAANARLTAPPGPRPSPRRRPSAHEGQPVMPGCRRSRLSRPRRSSSDATMATKSGAERLQGCARVPTKPLAHA